MLAQKYFKEHKSMDIFTGNDDEPDKVMCHITCMTPKETSRKNPYKILQPCDRIPKSCHH